jgi:hypothetical protein
MGGSDLGTAGERVLFLVGLLERSLADYEAGRSDMARLVRDVESVIDSLADVADAAWVSELRERWGALEIVYALMLDESRASPTDDERGDVAEAVSALRLLLKR